MGWEETIANLPTEKTAAQKAERGRLFDSFDPNGNGYLSLAELDRGCRDVLGLDNDVLPAPVLMRAYQASRGVAQDDGTNTTTTEQGRDFVERSEFRLFLVYVRRYLELWRMFDRMDDDNDRRVSLEEFEKSVDKLAEWNVKVNDPQAKFAEIDRNGGGMVLFDEFARWAMQEVFKSIDRGD